MDELVAKYERDAAESKIEKPSLRMIFGDMYSEKKNYEEALRQYVAALEVAPNRGDVRKKVIDILRRMPERSDELIEQYRDWLKYDPKNVSLYREMGDLLKRSGREADVMRAYTTMLEAMPTEAESHREMAAIYTGMNRHTDAVNMWKKVVRYRPEEPRSYYGLADSYRRGKQIALAADVYRQMIKRSWESRFGDVRGVARNRLRKTEAEM